jgi:hypothetical protein
MMIVDEVEAWLPSLRGRRRFTSVPKRHLADPSLAAGLMGYNTDGLLGDIRTLEDLFESLATRTSGPMPRPKVTRSFTTKSTPAVSGWI